MSLGYCVPCKNGKENICKNKIPTYGTYWGGYSTSLQEKADWCFKLLKNFDIRRGASLLCAGITTFYPIKCYLSKSTIKNTG